MDYIEAIKDDLNRTIMPRRDGKTGQVLARFSTPEELYNCCLEYIKFCKENPLHRAEQSRQSKKDEHSEPIIDVPVPRPMSIYGLAAFIGCGRRTLYLYASDKDYKDFWPVMAMMDDIIKNQQYEQAAVGSYKENIVGRMIGLADKTETEVTMKMEISYEDMNGEE